MGMVDKAVVIPAAVVVTSPKAAITQSALLVPRMVVGGHFSAAARVARLPIITLQTQIPLRVDLGVAGTVISLQVVEEVHRVVVVVFGRRAEAAAAGHTPRRPKQMSGRGQATGTSRSNLLAEIVFQHSTTPAFPILDRSVQFFGQAYRAVLALARCLMRMAARMCGFLRRRAMRAQVNGGTRSGHGQVTITAL